MTLAPIICETPDLEKAETYEQAKTLHSNIVWQKLNEITVGEAISYWLPTLSLRTRINYRSGLNKLMEYGLIDPEMSLQGFALVNHEAIVDRIKLIQGWSECSRQARASCYISFTGFLNRRLQGVVKKAIPNKEGSGRTFFRVCKK